jgi:site-specific DNA recombinase
MRIGMYARVSTTRQAEAQSTEQQLERLRAHVATHAAEGWELREEHIFRDDGYSGASLRRPGLDRLRDAVAAAALDRVLLTAPDRLARNYVHQMLLLDELQRQGCQVEFLERPMSQDPHDQLLLQIRGAVAEYERALIAERMRRGRLRKLQAGLLLPWTRAPYGYRLDPERPRDPAGVRVEEAEAAVVRELFAQYLEPGGSLAGLAKRLYSVGMPTPTGKRCWHPNTIRLLLTTPAYAGQVYAGRSRPRAARGRWSALRPVRPGSQCDEPLPPAAWMPVAPVPALVSQEQFDQVQAKLAHNQQFARRHNTAHRYLLRALVSCGVCQLCCVGRTCHSHRPAYAYYQCRGKTHPVLSSREQKCPARFIPATQLDDLVWADLCDVLLHPASLVQALERAQGGHWLPQELQARREQLRRGALQLASQVERLSEAYLQGVIPLAEYQRRRRDLEQRQEALAHQSQQLELQVRNAQAVAGLAISVEAFCQRVQVGLTQATFEQKRQLVELLIDRVVVTDGDVEVRYVIPTTPASEHTRFCHLRTDYFDPPVATHPLQHPRGPGGGGQAGQEIAHLADRRVIWLGGPAHHTLNLQDQPHPAPAQARQRGVERRRGAQRAHFHAVAMQLGLLGRLKDQVGGRVGEPEHHLGEQLGLVGLDGKQVIAPCAANLPAERPLARERIARHQPSAQRHPAQQRGRHAQLSLLLALLGLLLGLDPPLAPIPQAGLSVVQRHQAHPWEFLAVDAPQRLAVNRHRRARRPLLVHDRDHPLLHRRLEGRRIQRLEGVVQHGHRRRARPRDPQRPHDLRRLPPTPLGNGVQAARSSQHGRCRQGQHRR